jgi:multidrug efflux system outer membrane protein
MKSFPALRRRVGMLGLTAAGVLTIAACTLEPHYVRPDPQISQVWPDGGGAATTSATAAAEIGWREFFTDEKLQKLIELSLQHNPDAQVAALNIAAARAQYQIQRADLFPKISASGVEQVEKFPAGVASIATAPGGGGATTGAVDSAGSGVFRYFDVGVGFTSYEIDLFGKIRSLNKQKLQQYLGYIETRRSTVISLISEVANAYLTWLADQKLLQITQDTFKSQQDSLGLVRRSFDGGVSTALDLHQAETTVATAQANLAQYTRQVAQDRNALVVLIGAPLPDDLSTGLPPGADLDEQKLLTDLPAGVPSEVLTQRPDVLAAEHNLIAGNANIGAARAAFFPSITLTGSYGTASTQLSGLFNHGTTAWTFSPQISVPIFAGGANVAGLKLANVQKDVLVVQYEQSIQGAFREVADGLAGRATLDAQVSADESLVNASSEYYRLSNMRFTNGVDTYLTVLDSQRQLYTAQQSLVTTKLQRAQNLVTLYKALGGGWQEHGPTAAREP